MRWQMLLLIGLLVVGCKKAFTPPGVLSGTNKYLVIEGDLNGGTDTTFFKLSRTKKFDTIITINPEAGAQMMIESDANSSFPLAETIPGTYSAVGLNLNVAQKYRVRIKTIDNEEYLSDYVTVKNAPPVDSLGFLPKADGVHIYVNAHDASNATRYYRWEYNEDWEFHTFYESFWDGTAPRAKADYKYFCFAKDVSSAILINSTTNLSNDVIFQAPIAVIPSTSEKIQIRYSILVRQYALTSDAYSFWQNLQRNTDRLGTIFDAQPSENQSNYHSVTNPNEIVIGYLSAGNYTTKRIYINAGQLLPGYAVPNTYGCKVDTGYFYHHPYYYPPDVNLSDPNSGYTSLDGFYIAPLAPFGGPSSITYAATICADCTLRGSLKPPAFWK